MLLHIPSVLSPDQVSHARLLLEKADWIDGRATAGRQSMRTKNNKQVRENTPAARELGEEEVDLAAQEN